MLCTLALLLAFDAEPHDAEQPAFEQHTVDPHGEAITTNTAPRAVFILVGSLTDSLDSTSPGACTAGGDDVAAADPAAAAGCTLRAAMQLANRYGKATAVTIRVRSGRIAVAGPLPTLEGTVQMSSGPTGPIGTVLDGGKRDGAGVQILRTGSGSAVALHTLRFENGRAMGSSDDGWGEHGGAIHARGTLVLTNCAIRNCEAFNGGGVYAEGDEPLLSICT
ncbi:hypothetical protein EMIHUDRAFT_233916 [Emiliania huxleyi CCMP1516]|uniref:Right handed beta helix domain-containing protein n=2 Tax=Emiliania huxleyi TaxID=2903 RepID=A0A0D3K1A0_EMIH1|nr:hypothetical protein EMIHUDRAFT_233916 [Emiliania huxleyi CCMP1516]EOD29535.1 hypothetical protein EMIHUDRAFT_233916 [Emiliania huxleyi CCMP1516]|eukprot:XP_005781964.1 hypothetical protein EMIHUDRAFT_233916 [Emiliania huxleyi CCMP1516]